MPQEEEQEHTRLLPPIVAIRIAWAMTGSFSSASESHNSALLAEKRLKDIYDESQKQDDSLNGKQLAQREKEKNMLEMPSPSYMQICGLWTQYIRDAS